MKKILLVASGFAPENVIGAVRLTKLAKNLTEYGYEVTVITKRPYNVDEKLNEDIKFVSNIIRVDQSKMYKQYLTLYKKIIGKFKKVKKTNNNSIGISQKKSTSKESLIIKIYRFLENVNSLLGEEDYYRRVVHYIKSNDLSLSSYNYMISTFNPMENHKIGEYIKKHNRNIVWVADFRDPVITHRTKSKLKRRLYKSSQNKTLKQSDYIVAVSNGYLKMITNNKYSEKSRVIHNGFDSDDYRPEKLSDLIDKHSNKLRLVYTGGLYSGERDLTPLLKILSILLDKNVVDENTIELVYAGQQKDYFDSLIKIYGLENITKSFNYITRSEALSLQNTSDILIVATWNHSDYYGVLPGKLFEYMQARKNIIALVNGNKGDSEIKEIIDECNIGVCYENANKDIDTNRLYNFIKNAYQNKLLYSKIPLNSNVKKIEEFNYKNITKQFIDLINK